MKVKILENIEVVEYGAILVNSNTLIIGDLHLGHERDLIESGIFMPKFQLKDILKRLEFIFEKYKPTRIVLNGDTKHLFGNINRQEWSDIRKLLDFCEKHAKEIVIVRGNHDNYLQTIIKSNKVRFFEELFVIETKGKNKTQIIAITHGHKKIDTKKYHTIIIGNEHPAISISTGVGDVEKFPCAIYGKIGKATLIVHPAFSPLALGVNVLTNKEWLSDVLGKINTEKFKVIAVDEKELFIFPEIEKIRQKM